MFTKYFNSIKKSETFEKIQNDALLKLGYKIIRVGSGNFITTPAYFKKAGEEDSS